MNEELRKAVDDYFDASDFVGYIGVTVLDLIEAFPEKVDEAEDEILELMGLTKSGIMNEEDENEA